MTNIFLKMLGAFYYERMVASAPNDFTEMVGMGIRLEEAVREGRLTKSEGPEGVKNPSVVPQNFPSHISQNIARKISKLLKIAQELDNQAIS